MGSRQYDKYCEQMYQEWLESEAEADRQSLEEEQEAARADEEYESQRQPMTYEQAEQKFLCSQCQGDNYDISCDCVLSATCSFKCKACGKSNYFQGDLDDAPGEFDCVYCGEKIINKFKRRKS